MDQPPPLRIELPFQAGWTKHIEKLDTSVFPYCHTIEREWPIRRGFLRHRNIVHVHHEQGCRFSVLRIREEAGEIAADQLL